MRKGRRMNEHGVFVGVYECEACEREFTVCPDPEKEDGWEGCLGRECASYDPKRDVDLIWDDPALWDALHEGDTTLRQVPTGRYN